MKKNSVKNLLKTTIEHMNKSNQKHEMSEQLTYL